MHRLLLPLAAYFLTVYVAGASADDEIIIRAQDKPYRGLIKGESARGVEIKGGKETVAAEAIVDIVYEVTPVDVLINLYRPAVLREKDYNDPDPKKEARRKANLDEAIKKYAEAYTKVNEKSAKRHIEYKLALLSARQALDNNDVLEAAIKRFTDFKIRHPDSWQITACLQFLGKLQLESKQYREAEETYQELARANVPDDTKQEADLLVAQVSIKAGKHEAALDLLKKLAAKLPSNSKYQGRIKVAQAECLAAFKKDAEADALLRQVVKDTTDKDLKALAYNTLGVNLYNGDHIKEARWEFLWVDVVYNQDKAEHAKALYYLVKIFNKLDEKEHAQECREALLNDRAFAGMEWQRLAQKEK